MVKQPVKGDVSGTIRHWVKPLVSPRHSLCQERHCTSKARCNTREATRLRSLSRWIPQRVKMHHASTWFVSFIKWLSHVCMYEYVWIYSNIYIYIHIIRRYDSYDWNYCFQRHIHQLWFFPAQSPAGIVKNLKPENWSPEFNREKNSLGEPWFSR